MHTCTQAHVHTFEWYRVNAFLHKSCLSRAIQQWLRHSGQARHPDAHTPPCSHDALWSRSFILSEVAGPAQELAVASSRGMQWELSQTVVNELWGWRAGQCISKESGHCVPFPAGISMTHVTGPPRLIPPALNFPGHHITSLCRLKQSGVLAEDKYTTMSWYFSTWETFWNWSLTHEENSFLIGLNLRIEICGIHFRK